MVRNQARVILNSKRIGIMIYPNEDKYEGEWEDNERNGTGKLYAKGRYNGV